MSRRQLSDQEAAQFYLDWLLKQPGTYAVAEAWARAEVRYGAEKIVPWHELTEQKD